MNRTNHRHVYAAVLILLVALATLGIAYGQWTDTLTINGTVTTGEVDVDWVSFGCYDGEDQATIQTVLSEDEDTIIITVENGYPDYVAHCWANSRVRGTIPVYIKSIDFTPGSNLSGCSVEHDTEQGSFTATCSQLEVEWTNGLCKKFNVGSGEGSNMQFSVLNGAEQNTSYQFTVSYTFEQATAGGCTAP
jgi:hypothetical protein